MLKNVELDRTTLLFTTLVSLVSGIAFGLAPAVHAIRQPLAESLKAASGKASAARSALRGRQTMVVTQVALCMLLLAMAGLLIRTILNLRAVDPGFDASNVIVAPMAMNTNTLESAASLRAFQDQALQRIHAIPGVEAAAVTTQLPVTGQFNLQARLPDSPDPTRLVTMQVRIHTQETFRVLGMRLLRGRDFQSADAGEGAQPVVVVNEAFARTHAKSRDVIGTRVDIGNNPAVVVGVVNDIRETGLRSPTPPAVYLPMEQTPIPIIRAVFGFVSAKWVVRLAPGVRGVGEQIRKAVDTVDPSQPLQEFKPMPDLIAETMSMERFLSLLLAMFAILTLAMVASGLYGTLAYAVEQRKPELGIRLALGAASSEVAGMVVRGAMWQVAAGLIIGLAATYWAAKLMAGFLFNMKPIDPLSLAASVGTLLLVGLLASAGPSWTAARTDPMRTLRAE